MIEKSAVLFANGEFNISEKIMEIIDQAEFLMAVDGGYNHMERLGLTPDVIVGDLDSINLDDTNELENKGIEIKKYPVHKDETDLELAVDHILNSGYEKINILGATGGRTDHFLGTILLFSNPKYQDKEIKIWTDQEEIFYCKNDQAITGNQGDLISLIPISDQVMGISTQGLLYPLKNEPLVRWKSRGISNRMSEFDVKIHFKAGSLLCIHRYSMEQESR
jgi:thiamine pyrophosphokinase